MSHGESLICLIINMSTAVCYNLSELFTVAHMNTKHNNANPYAFP